jgi:hypothetical protein
MTAEDIGKTGMVPALPKMPQAPYDPWAERQSGNPMTRILDHVLTCELPENPEDYHDLFELMLNVAGTNPNCTLQTIRKWKRDIIDIDDRAHSEGRTQITAAKARKLLFEMRAYMSRGDNPHLGLSGVSAAITFRHQAEQTLRMPQQPAEKGFFRGLLQRRGE